MTRHRVPGKAFAEIDDSDAGSDGRFWQLARILNAKPDLNVLIVDDNSAMRSSLRKFLVSFGIYNVQEAKNGVEGLACIQRNTPDVAIVDSDMAEMDGVTFVKHVRCDLSSPDPSLPVVVTTGAPDRRKICEFRDAGITDILCKPFAPKAFAKHIVSTLENEREFIRSSAYRGPDRRCQQAKFSGSDHRTPIDVRLQTLPKQKIETDYWE